MQGGNFIYKFNTSLSLYADNRKNEHDGFEIIGKIDISDLSEEQQNRFENEYRKNRGNINSTLAQLGLSQRTSDGGVVVIDYGEGYENYDTMDSQPSTSDRGRGNRDSKGNQGASEIADHVMRDLVNGFNPNQVTNGVDYQRRNHLIGEKGARGLDRAEEKAMAYVSVAHLSHRPIQR